MKKCALFLTASIAMTIAGCATTPLSERALGQKIPVARDASGDGLAEIVFSADQRYQTAKGVPLLGDPLICGREGIFRVNNDNAQANRVSVRAGEEVAVTSVVEWVNAGIRKTCWPFVTFTPESRSKYIVVSERVGGKGLSALWTGVAFQTCEVSVYRESPAGIQRVEARHSSINECRAAARPQK